jgi:hypothetical protein
MCIGMVGAPIDANRRAIKITIFVFTNRHKQTCVTILSVNLRRSVEDAFNYLQEWAKAGGT